MDRREEVQLAFTTWEMLNQLSALLLDQYHDEFNEIINQLEQEYHEQLETVIKNTLK